MLALRMRICDMSCIQQQLPATKWVGCFLQGPKCFTPARAAPFELFLLLFLIPWEGLNPWRLKSLNWWKTKQASKKSSKSFLLV